MVNKSRITIDRVALAAGVSPQTVSRVLNDRPDVAPETRARVKQVMHELGYQPSAIARSLASQRTRTLGLITADFSDYFFAQVIAGAETEARKHGYLFMLGSTERNPADEPEYIRLFSEQHVAGFLFTRESSERDDPLLIELSQSGVPIVTTEHRLAGNLFTVVDVDNVAGGRQVARHLLDRGHRQIAMIQGPSAWKSVHARNNGFISELQSDGIALDDRLVSEGDWSHASGYSAMRELLNRGEPFSAIFVHNDQMAIGAIHALSEAGKRIPEDVAIVGYDDIPAAEYSEPPLTTIRQPIRELGAVAARLLIQKIEQEDKPNTVVLLKPELVVRET